MTTGIVLAAGSGTRIGCPKALLRTGRGDESFLERACAALCDSGVDAVIAVVAPNLAKVAVTAMTRVLVNDDPGRGQLSSLQIALAALDPSTDAIVVLPVDVPLVRPDTIRALVARWEESRPKVVRPVRTLRGAQHGHPVVFDRAVFDDLAHAPLSEGAKPVVHRHASPSGEVTVEEDAGAFTDIDTVEEYVEVFGRLPEAVSIR